MTLPATFVEAEATAFARRDIAYVRSGQLKLWGVEPGRWFEKGDNQRYCREGLCRWALQDVTHLMDAVAMARAGYELWEDSLRDLILEFQNRGEKMPVYLEAFAMELTRGIRYSAKAGRHRADNLVRDMAICTIISRVAERFNLKPTRGYYAKSPSGCSVVAAALGLEGMAMSEANVITLWKDLPTHYKNMKWSQWLSA